MSCQRPSRHHEGADPEPCCPPWPPNGTSPAGTAGANSADLPPRLAVPKMGVRARIAEWPPKRDAPKDTPSPRDQNSPSGAHQASGGGGGGGANAASFKALQRLARRRSKEVEFQDGWGGRCQPVAPLRQRSSSEVTLSECDPEEVPAQPGGAAGLGSATGLYREYGSTSSIDAQGVSEQSFFEMLNELRAKRPSREAGTKLEVRNGCREDPLVPSKEKPRRRCPKDASGGSGSGGGGSAESIFKKLRSARSEGDGAKEALEEPKLAEPGKPWLCQKSFAHYDVQSLLFDLNLVAANRATGAQRRNTTTGASAASVATGTGRHHRGGGIEGTTGATTTTYGGGGGPSGALSATELPSASSTEELNWKENLEEDLGDNTSNELLLSCPHFRNEIGGSAQRDLSFSRATTGTPWMPPGGHPEVPTAFRPTNAGISVLEVAKELQRNPNRLRHHSVEHVDLGALYYREHFHGKEHSNYFGQDERLGPVAVSIRREKLEDHKEHGPQYQYRIILRTSELTTLRGSILEDATPSATKAGTLRGLPLRDTLGYLVPELNLQCLRLASSAPRVTEQLLKLDEQGLCRRHKVGILYCKAGQSSEEEMYNNEEAGPALEEFLSLLGEKVSLKAFPKYAAQLDTKTDSTGTHSLYTTYQDYEIMFHVSTMLPYTPNNRQQLLRKRHIGNDIVTIIFQEPGALPFTPQNIRSHFQHVFIIVRAHQPCSQHVCYSVAVTRSKDVPPFGPPLPAPGSTFSRSELFRDFLLAKAINAENAAHKSRKFHAMATRTRQEYLKDLAQNYVTNTPLDSSLGKFNLISSLASKKKEKTKARLGAEVLSAGAIAWRLAAQDFAAGSQVPCVLGVSNEFVVLLDLQAKEVVFNCFCGDVVGWSAEGQALKVFHGRGDHVLLRAGSAEEVREIVQRLKAVTGGCEASELTLRRNGLGQLGFHVRADGTVAEVEDYGFAWQAGLRAGSRLLEVCKVALAALSHEQMIDLLRTSVTVTVVTVPPRRDGSPRRGWLEELQRRDGGDEPGLVAGGRPPYRSNAAAAGGWQWAAALGTGGGGGGGGGGQHGRGGGKAAAAHGKRPVSYPETPPQPSSCSSSSSSPAQGFRQPSGSFSAPASAGTGTGHGSGHGIVGHSAPYRHQDRSGPPQRPPLPPDPDGGLESAVERHRAEPLWHVPAASRLPATAVGSTGTKRPGKDSPSRHSKAEVPLPGSSPSSSTTSSDEHCLEPPDPAPPHDDPHPKDPPPTADLDPPPLTANLSMPTPQEEGTKELSPAGHRHKLGTSEPFKLPGSRLAPANYDPPRAPPKAFFSKQPLRSKQPPGGWKRPQEPPDPKKQVEAGSKNVFGQPRLRASLRDLRSPRRSHKSSIEDDLKRLIIMDPAAAAAAAAAADAPPGPAAAPKGLQRTLSDESLCGGRRDLAPPTPPAMSSGGAVTSSGAASGGAGAGPGAFPSSTLPGRRPLPGERRGAALLTSETAPGLMPLPDPAAGLEWSSLVSAARAYEVQRAVSLFSLTEPAPSPDPPAAPPSTTPPLDLPGKVSQLEAMLRQLHSDLQKEKQDKVVLQAEVASLRQNNRRLQEESSSAARQLRRFARIFSGAGDKEEL